MTLSDVGGDAGLKVGLLKGLFTSAIEEARAASIITSVSKLLLHICLSEVADLCEFSEV